MPVAPMKRSQAHLKADIPTVKNPAKRYAGQLMGRWVTVVGSGLMTTVARRWKGQINEVAKAGANFEFIPEADHNTLAGTMNPRGDSQRPYDDDLPVRTSDHPRNRLRMDLTRKAFMLEGLNTDVSRSARPYSAGAHVDDHFIWRLHGLLPGNGLWRGPHPDQGAGGFQAGHDRSEINSTGGTKFFSHGWTRIDTDKYL